MECLVMLRSGDQQFEDSHARGLFETIMGVHMPYLAKSSSCIEPAGDERKTAFLETLKSSVSSQIWKLVLLSFPQG